MNKRRDKALITIMATMLFLAACGIETGGKVYSEETAVPEVSSQDLLVNSLEYLLEDKDETSQDEEEAAPDAEPPAPDSGSGNEAEEAAQSRNRAADGSQEEAADTVEAVIYYGKAGTLTLEKETTGVTAVTPEALLDRLAGHNIVSLDTKILSFEQEDRDGASVLYLDLSKAASEYLDTMSKEAECIIVSAIADTFLDNYGADGIYITVEGGPLTTAHSQYEQMLTVCTPEELMAAMADTDS